MARSITTKTYPYVLECDQSETNKELVSIFHVVPQTVRGVDEGLANLRGVVEDKKKKQGSDINVGKLFGANEGAWAKAVKKIERYTVEPEAPENAHVHFSAKAEDEPAIYVKNEDGSVTVVSTENEKDIIAIYNAMDPSHSEEVMKAHVEFSTLKEAVKNA